MLLSLVPWSGSVRKTLVTSPLWPPHRHRGMLSGALTPALLRDEPAPAPQTLLDSPEPFLFVFSLSCPTEEGYPLPLHQYRQGCLKKQHRTCTLPLKQTQTLKTNNWILNSAPSSEKPLLNDRFINIASDSGKNSCLQLKLWIKSSFLCENFKSHKSVFEYSFLSNYFCCAGQIYI